MSPAQWLVLGWIGGAVSALLAFLYTTRNPYDRGYEDGYEWGHTIGYERHQRLVEKGGDRRYER